MQKYVLLDKAVGQTPLECTELWRSQNTEYHQGVPLAYAGRLDPMASGKLLVLIGDECKVQEKYHGLDKEYEFSILLGVGSDTADVLGLLDIPDYRPINLTNINQIAKRLTGKISLPYPHFSSKTIQGKPLHVWTLEGRLNEITIPTKDSEIYKIAVTKTEKKTRTQIYDEVVEKIGQVTPVTDERKALGNDFRREDVLADWSSFANSGRPEDTFTIVHIKCTASSGTYMRTLATVIAGQLGTKGLAYHINRTKIGKYQKILGRLGYWSQIY